MAQKSHAARQHLETLLGVLRVSHPWFFWETSPTATPKCPSASASGLSRESDKFPFPVSLKIYLKCAQIWLIRFPEERRLKDCVGRYLGLLVKLLSLIVGLFEVCGILEKVLGDQEFLLVGTNLGLMACQAFQEGQMVQVVKVKREFSEVRILR